MSNPHKQTISAQLPVELVQAVEELAKEMDRSKSWIIKEALTSMIEARKQRNQMIQAGLDDVDAGRVISHDEMIDFAKRLKE